MFGAGLLLLCSTDSQAMPNFARKYNADCSMCHIFAPKLNKMGYEFRLAGYRLPSEIGKEEKQFNLGDFFAARVQEQYKYTKHSSDTSASKNVKTSNLEFFEFTMYPLTGSWGKNFASIGEFSMAPDDVFEIENAFVRGVYGDDKGWFQARVGIMHPWEGVGASDRPIGTTRPLFQKSKATGSPFILWNLDESAAEVGYHLGTSGTSISARVSNGILWKEDGSGAAEPAQGGALNKGTSADLAANRKNYQVFINQFITDTAAVSLYWYQGTIPFLDPNLTGLVYTSGSGNTTDTFTRTALYANYWAVPSKINLLAGYEYGRDSLDNGSIIVSGTDADGNSHTFNGSQVGKNKGYFGEVDLHPSSKLALAARYDYFDPSDKTGNDKQTAVSVSANYDIVAGLNLIADYQKKETEQSTAGKKKDDLYQARLIFIW